MAWSLDCDGLGTPITGGAPYNEAHAVPPGNCTLEMTDSFGDGWGRAEWSAPDWTGDVYSLRDGNYSSVSFIAAPRPPRSPPLPPPPPGPPALPPSPPAPPLQPGSRYAISSSELITALNDAAVERIVLRAGTYELLTDQIGCGTVLTGASDQPIWSALCINRSLTIEAEVAGGVQLHLWTSAAAETRMPLHANYYSSLLGLPRCQPHNSSPPNTAKKMKAIVFPSS